MLFLLSGVVSLGSVAALTLLTGKAPEAYETENGLNVIRPAHDVPAGKLTAAAQAQP